jgi:hypothetical protein
VGFRPDTVYDEPVTPKANIFPVQSPEVKTGAPQVAALVKRVNLKKPLPLSSSKEPSVPKKKNDSGPKPFHQTKGKAQVSSDESILLRLDSQFQQMARQFQSFNARLNNFEGTSSDPKQNTKPFSKKDINFSQFEKKKKKVSKLSVPITFTEKSVLELSELDQKLPGTYLVGSSEPITRWVPKNN